MKLPRLPQGIAQSNEAANVYQNDLNKYLALRERTDPTIDFGVWLPALVSLTGTNPSVTYGNNNRGRWLRTGPMMQVSGCLSVTSRTGGTGQAAIGNLPFLCADDDGGRGGLHIDYASGFSSTTTAHAAIPEKLAAIASLWRAASADARDATVTAVLVTDCVTPILFFSGLYFIQ